MLLIFEWFTQVTGFLKQYPVLFFSILGHHVGCWFWRSCLHFICCHCFVPCWIFYAKLDQNAGSHIRKLDKQFYPITYYQNLSSWVVLQLWLSREWKWYSFFFFKTSWWYLYDYLVIMIFDVYWCFKQNFHYMESAMLFFFHLQSEAKLNVRFTLIFILIIYTRWQIVKRGGGLIGTYSKTLRALVPFDWPSPKLS